MMEAAGLSDKSHRVCEGKKESREIPRVELCNERWVALYWDGRAPGGAENLAGRRQEFRGSCPRPVLVVTIGCSFSCSPNSALLAVGI